MTPILFKGLNAMLMQNSLEDGTETTGNGQIMFYIDIEMPYLMLGAQYYGQASYKQKLH